MLHCYLTQYQPQNKWLAAGHMEFKVIWVGEQIIIVIQMWCPGPTYFSKCWGHDGSVASKCCQMLGWWKCIQSVSWRQQMLTGLLHFSHGISTWAIVDCCGDCGSWRDENICWLVKMVLATFDRLQDHPLMTLIRTRRGQKMIQKMKRVKCFI